MQLNIITPEKTLFSAEASMVVIPGTLGDFGVLPGHMPFISTIRPGVISINGEDGVKRRLGVLGGIAEVVPERCTVLAETAIDCEGWTTAEAQAKLQDAKNLLDAAANDADKLLAQKQMALAEAILEAL